MSWVSTEGAHEKTLEDIQSIRDWPGPGRDADYAWKTPSRIAYAEHNEQSKNQWGFEVTPKSKCFTWMKLLLDPEQASKYDDPELASSEGQGVLALPHGKSAVDVCSDFLAEVASFSVDHLKKRISPEILRITPLRFCFTVPAVWSDKAKADTLKAAQQAAKKARLYCGAGVEVFMVQEPEAAAIAAISMVAKGGSTRQIKASSLLPVAYTANSLD